ncbi:hypothetical protein PG993_010034 [Apiospora rasikravindrae]|uniref:Uncharacterized protein n=1 Tax=Apiospora rasikravindrae TaxID=990691 RepID=A0ABR1SL29_9PEZI
MLAFMDYARDFQDAGLRNLLNYHNHRLERSLRDEIAGGRRGKGVHRRVPAAATQRARDARLRLVDVVIRTSVTVFREGEDIIKETLFHTWKGKMWQHQQREKQGEQIGQCGEASNVSTT